MKYPKEVYVIGNEFKIKGEGKGRWNYFRLYQGFHQVTNKRHELRYLELHEIHELTAITAETLIKLARKKKEWVAIEDIDERICIVSETKGRPLHKCYSYKKKNLNETLLEVAKERGYIT